MIIFHELVYDGPLISLTSGSGGTMYSPFHFAALFGRVDMLHIGGYASQVSGTSPQIDIGVEGSNDGYEWRSETGGSFATALTPTETNFQALSLSSKSNPASAYRRLAIQVVGSSNTFVGHARIWVTGRDTSKNLGLEKDLTS